MHTPSAYYLIEGGKPLELLREHFAERERVFEANKAIADELGIKKGHTDTFHGQLLTVCFEGKVPEGWTKKDKHGASRPKAVTEWAQRFKDLKGWREPSLIIAEAFGIPTCLSYKRKEGTSGWRHIGNMFKPCGFLWADQETGPWALYIPDVAEAIRSEEADGGEVTEPATRDWTLNVPGMRRIELEEWEIACHQYTLEKRRREKEAAAAAEATEGAPL